MSHSRELENRKVSVGILPKGIPHIFHLSEKWNGVWIHGIPWPKLFKGVKYQGSGWKGSKGSRVNFFLSPVQTRVCVGYSSSSLIIYSILRRPRSSLIVTIIFLSDEGGACVVAIIA